MEIILAGLEVEQKVENDVKFQEAVINFNLLAEKYKENHFVEKYSLFNTGFIYFKYLNDYKSAEEKFNELVSKYLDDNLLTEVKYLLGELESIQGEGTLRPKSSSKEINQSFNYALQQNYPNPFNPITKIDFSVAEEGQYALRIFNILGQEVKILFEEYLKPGNYNINFNAADFSSGVYIYQITGGKKSLSKKMILTK